MAGELTDRRVRKTRRILRESLLALLKKKKISSISVRELTDMADIGRGTFYLHYKSIADLMEGIKKDLQEELTQMISRHEGTELRTAPGPMLNEFYVLVYQNMDLIRILMEQNRDLEFFDSLGETLEARYRSACPEEPDPDSRAFFHFLVYGCMGLVRHWMTDGLQETPEQMAELTEQFLPGTGEGRRPAGKQENRRTDRTGKDDAEQ